MRGSLVLYTISWLLVEQDRFWYFFLRWENGEVRIPGWVMMVLSHFMQIWQSKEFVYCKEGVEVRWGVCFKTVLKQSSFVLKKKKSKGKGFFWCLIWHFSIFLYEFKVYLHPCIKQLYTLFASPADGFQCKSKNLYLQKAITCRLAVTWWKLEFKCESIFKWSSPTLFPCPTLLAAFLFITNSVLKSPVSISSWNNHVVFVSLTSPLFLGFSFVPTVAEFPSFHVSHMPILSVLTVLALIHASSLMFSLLTVLPSSSPFANLSYICNRFFFFLKYSLICGHSNLYNAPVPLAGCRIKYQSCVPSSKDCCPFLVQILRFPSLQILGLLSPSETLSHFLFLLSEVLLTI